MAAASTESAVKVNSDSNSSSKVPLLPKINMFLCHYTSHLIVQISDKLLRGSAQIHSCKVDSERL